MGKGNYGPMHRPQSALGRDGGKVRLFEYRWFASVATVASTARFRALDGRVDRFAVHGQFFECTRPRHRR